MDTSVDEARLRVLMARSRTLHADAGAGVPAAAAGARDDDIAVLQTAASLENLAVSTYTAALDLVVVTSGNPAFAAFVTATRGQHADHAMAFNAAVTQAGGAVQTDPDPRYDKIAQAAPLTSVADVVALAALLEDVTAQTYTQAATLVSTSALRSLFVSVAAVEAQHRAILLAVGDLLAAKVALGTDVSRLPSTVGAVGFPVAFTPVTRASPASEGAIG